MSHDYAKRGRKRKKRTKHLPVRPRSVLFIVLVLALVIGFFVYRVNSASHLKTDTLVVDQQIVDQPAEDTSPPSERVKPKFDFYTLLPQRTVTVPEPTVDAEEKAVIYTLQTASFKRREDADRQCQQLEALGLNAQVDLAQQANGSLWYRVYVGPFTSRSVLATTRSLLAEHGIIPLALKQRVEAHSAVKSSSEN